jgi:hypothetical protein
MADESGQAYLKHHAHLAERWVFLYYITAVVALAGLITCWKWPRVLAPISLVATLLALVSLGAGIAIAHEGGQIRHREFRYGPPPAEDANK